MDAKAVASNQPPPACDASGMTLSPGCSCEAVLAASVCLLLIAPALSGDAQESHRGLKAQSEQAAGVVLNAPGRDDPWIEHLSWKPRAWLYHNFLTDEECDHMIELARPNMARSTVVDADTGDSMLDPIRTSEGTFLTRYQDAIVRDIEDRISHWTHLPASHGEDLQVLKYRHGQKYEGHYDWFDKDELKKMDDKDESNRIATVLMYLSDMEEGGETAFSRSHWLNETRQRHSEPSACASGQVFVKPKKGDALLFWDLKPDGQSGDKWSMHAGCPVIKGEKWSATKWLHNGEYGDARDMRRRAAEAARTKCADVEAECPGWAADGQCLKNPSYLVGTAKRPGNCMASCKACVPCAPGDLLCQRRSERMKKSVLRQAAAAKH